MIIKIKLWKSLIIFRFCRLMSLTLHMLTLATCFSHPDNVRGLMHWLWVMIQAFWVVSCCLLLVIGEGHSCDRWALHSGEWSSYTNIEIEATGSAQEIRRDYSGPVQPESVATIWRLECFEWDHSGRIWGAFWQSVLSLFFIKVPSLSNVFTLSIVY